MIIMNQDILKHQLHDEYLQTYQKIELLCHNLSFFMNDDGYFQITMQDEALDLLLEAQAHQQPVEYVFGDNLQTFIYERYKECLYYDFSYGYMGIIFVFLLYFMDMIFPQLFLYHYVETEYYMFMILPIIAKVMYWLNQIFLFKIVFKIKEKILNIISYIIYFIKLIVLCYIIFYVIAQQYTEIYVGIVLAIILLLYQAKSKNRSIKEMFHDTVKKQTLSFFFEIEIISVILIFSAISRFIQPLNTTGYFVWFIPLGFIVGLTALPLKGLKGFINQENQEELLDQYLSHYQFLKTKRQMTHDIPLTKEQYFIKLQKKHQKYRKLFPIISIGLIISFILFMLSFQMSVFYILMIGYTIYALYHLYCYYHMKDMINEISRSQINIKA